QAESAPALVEGGGSPRCGRGLPDGCSTQPSILLGLVALADADESHERSSVLLIFAWFVADKNNRGPAIFQAEFQVDLVWFRTFLGYHRVDMQCVAIEIARRHFQGPVRSQIDGQRIRLARQGFVFFGDYPVRLIGVLENRALGRIEVRIYTHALVAGENL